MGRNKKKKALNYWEIHPNKKRKIVKTNQLHPNVIKCISIAKKIIKQAIERAQLLSITQQPKPNYAIVGSNDKPEIILDRNGNKKELDLNILIINESIKTIKNSFPTVEEVSKNFEIASVELRKSN